MTKILLTGITGFIGSHIARQIIKDDVVLYAIVRKESDLWRIKDISSHVHLIEGDLFSENVYEHLYKLSPDICIHAAWGVKPGEYLHTKENLDYVKVTLQLAETMQKIGCKRLVGLGTCFEYDVTQGYLAENSPIKPQNLYAASKLSTQLILDQFCKDFGMEFTWLRLFYLYGPFENPKRVIPYVITSLLKNETVRLSQCDQILDFLHVSDVASAIWQIAKNPPINHIINIGSGNPIRLRDIIDFIADYLGKNNLINYGAIPLKPDDPLFICANNQLLSHRTQWKPEYDLNKGIINTINWWQSNFKNNILS